MGDLFSLDFPLAADEVETLRLLLTDKLEVDVDDPDDEELDEEEFLLRRLVFELSVSLGLLLGRVSASFLFLGTTAGGWSWSESELTSISARTEAKSEDTGGSPV